MKTGLILTGGKLDMAFAGEFLCKYAEMSAAGGQGNEDAGASAIEEASVGDLETDGAGAAAEGTEENGGCRGAGRNAAAAAARNYGFDCVILVDGGLAHAAALGLTPAAIVGDFDTVRPEVLEAYRTGTGKDVLWDVHRPEKDETDTELAIHTAMKLGCTRLVILGATGGRLDHELSNIHLLKMCLDAGVEAALYDRQNRVSLLAGSRIFRRDEVYGKYVSFIPMTERVEDIRLSGFKYPLYGKTVTIGREAGLCVSNEITEETAEIRTGSGVLICIESKD